MISKIAYDPVITKARIQAKTIPEMADSEVMKNIRTFGNNLKALVQ